MIEPKLIAKGMKNEMLTSLSRMILLLDIVCIMFFFEDGKFVFEEILTLAGVALLAAVIETRITEKIGILKSKKNMKLFIAEFTSFLNEENISYKKREDVDEKISTLIIEYPTNKKYKLDYLLIVYIRGIFLKLLVKVQNDEIECIRVKELAEIYSKELEDAYLEELGQANDFFIAKKNKFSGIDINEKFALEENERCVFMQQDIMLYKFAKVETKSGELYYTNTRLIFIDPKEKEIKLEIKYIDRKNIEIPVSTYFLTYDKYIVNLNSHIKMKQFNEIMTFFK
ncbi:MAG: hypothetical protein RR751_05335 [Clostridia bacterium]